MVVEAEVVAVEVIMVVAEAVDGADEEDQHISPIWLGTKVIIISSII